MFAAFLERNRHAITRLTIIIQVQGSEVLTALHDLPNDGLYTVVETSVRVFKAYDFFAGVGREPLKAPQSPDVVVDVPPGHVA